MTITTKSQFFKQLPLGVDTADLSLALISWLDCDSNLKDNIILVKEFSEPTKSIIWSRKLLYNGFEYVIDYVTWNENIRKEKDSIYLQGEMVRIGLL